MAVKKTESAKAKKTTVKAKETAKTKKAVVKSTGGEKKKVTKKTLTKKVAPARPAVPSPSRVLPPPHAQEVIPVEPKPSARTCPLVLDGITAPARFSPRDCLSCDEFDCRFYAAEERSGGLGSRLFAADEGDDDFGDDGDDGGFYNDDADANGDDDYDEMR